MPSTVKPLDPNVRQQLAAMLSGDAKAGSIRADLVKGLIGSQTGEDSGLLGMTPLGAAFDVSAANRDRRMGGSGLGHTLSAAAGMIPGAAPEREAISAFVDRLAAEAPDKLEHLLSVWEAPSATHLVDALHMSQDPQAVKGMMGEITKHLDANKTVDTAPSIRAQLEAASKNDEKGATVVDAATPPTVKGTAASISDATKPHEISVRDLPPTTGPQAMAANRARGFDPTKGNPEQAEAALQNLAGGDPKKLNFIKNAMDDEGGNSPEDVAMTLLDHMKQRVEQGNENAFKLHDILAEHASDPKGEIGDITPQSLAAVHSIPEMLAMHYDLNPALLGKAYDMPGPKTRPTQ